MIYSTRSSPQQTFFWTVSQCAWIGQHGNTDYDLLNDLREPQEMHHGR